jgi:hypothetical protein
MCWHVGENTIKRARDEKVKILFQRLHMTHVISIMLVYNLKICILDTCVVFQMLRNVYQSIICIDEENL